MTSTASHRRRTLGRSTLALIALAIGSLALTGLAAATTTGTRLAPAVPSRQVVHQGELFYGSETSFNYKGGQVLLSSTSDGTGSTAVDDVLRLSVTHADGSTASYSHNYATSCTNGTIAPLPPTDVSSLFRAGANRVKLTLRDLCGFFENSTEIWLVQGGSSTT